MEKMGREEEGKGGKVGEAEGRGAGTVSFSPLVIFL